jgi:DNA-binding HxlR family transcriptional regulator
MREDAERSHTDEADVARSIQAAAEVLGKKWKAVILWYLRDGAKRYNELQALLAQATPKVLTEQLRELERDGLVARRVVPGRARHVEYSRTPLGASLEPIIDRMHMWGAEWTMHREYARATTPQIYPRPTPAAQLRGERMIFVPETAAESTPKFPLRPLRG